MNNKMQLRELLLEEHSKTQCDHIVGYIGADKKKFAALMELFFSGEYRVSQRAAWPMSYCVQGHPALIAPYLHRLIGYMGKEGVHDAIIRNSLRLLQHVDIPKKHHGELMNACFSFIEKPETAVAIKAFALTVLGNLARVYPEILPEIKLVIEDRFDHETAAFRSRARKLLTKQVQHNRKQ